MTVEGQSKLGPCIKHSSSCDRNGYAREMRNGVRLMKHHWALIDAGIPVPRNKIVLHLCNNPRCIRVEHLKIGTQSENIRMMYQQRRGVNNTGERNGQAKLSDLQAEEIKVKRRAGVKLAVLAREYRVSQSLVSHIAHGVRR